jgi:hypothetical protein
LIYTKNAIKVKIETKVVIKGSSQNKPKITSSHPNIISIGAIWLSINGLISTKTIPDIAYIKKKINMQTRHLFHSV